MRVIKSIIFIVLIVAVAAFLYLHKDTSKLKGEEPFYAGSDSCQQCHTKKHKSWHNSSHRKIFKKYTDDAQIIADFNNKPDFVTFDKKDIDVIIGYQWEQVFAREINGEMYPFPAKWMNLTQEWIPYKTYKWDKTPLTQKCNGCHTTGLNVETGEFKEYGVSCESCHGPASKHVEHKKILKNIECNICHNAQSLKEKLESEIDIVRSIKSAVCGQCHSRGVEKQVNTHQTEIQFNFPVEYLPGQKISENFQPTTPQTDKKGKNWWGNGVSKNRHQEYADFAKSGHAKSLKNLRIKRGTSCGGEPSYNVGEEPTDNCLECHSGDYITAKNYQDRVADKKEWVLPTIENAQDDITCVVCHNPHQVGDKNSKAADKCVGCHTKNTRTMKQHEQHYPCPTKEITCADCHMPKIVKTGGQFSLRSHAFRIIPPEATVKYGMPNSCQNGACHTEQSIQWVIDEYTRFYKDENTQKTLVHDTFIPEKSDMK